MLGPIFVREWQTLPRRPGHYVARTAYLGLLWVVGLTAWQGLVGWTRDATLGDTARFGGTLFESWAVLQLILVPVGSALAAAYAVAREKERRTFLLLLLTDLRDREIVLGKLVGSLLPASLLLLGSVPLQAMLILLGGVSVDRVSQVMVILAMTSLAAGSLGTLVALWREQTFPALALTLLGLVCYLALVRGLTPLDPFRALADDNARNVNESTFIHSIMGYSTAMLSLAVALNAVSVWRLRAWNPRGETLARRELPDREEQADRSASHGSPGTARRVWANPIFWREVGTRAYGRRPLLVKAAYFLAIGLLCLTTLAPKDSASTPFAAATALVAVLVLSLLLIAAQAVSAIASERDGGALDLLLVTDLTPGEFVFGKLGGIAVNVKEFLVPPLLLAGWCAAQGQLAAPGRALAAFVSVAATFLILAVFTIVLGVHVGLRADNSARAVATTLGSILFLSVGTLACVALIVVNRRFEAQWGSFVVFLLAGVAGLWWVLNGERPSSALTLASAACPPALLYAVFHVLIGRPGTGEAGDLALPALVVSGAFGLAIAAMLVPLLGEFDLALGRTDAGGG